MATVATITDDDMLPRDQVDPIKLKAYDRWVSEGAKEYRSPHMKMFEEANGLCTRWQPFPAGSDQWERFFRAAHRFEHALRSDESRTPELARALWEGRAVERPSTRKQPGDKLSEYVAKLKTMSAQLDVLTSGDKDLIDTFGRELMSLGGCIRNMAKNL